MNSSVAIAVMERRLATPRRASFDVSNLRQRFLSSLALAPIALSAIYLGGWFYIALVVICTCLALREWLRLIPAVKTHTKLSSYIAFILILGLAVWPLENKELVIATSVVSIILAFIFIGEFIRSMSWKGYRFSSTLSSLLGAVLLASSGVALIYLRAVSGIGIGLVFYLIIAVWGTDTGAYTVGKLIGGPKLCPSISPQKTWAGLFGGMVFAAAFGYAAASIAGARQPKMGLGLAVILAGVAQLGDLSKSYFKRRAGVKESGHLIPGHGGMLDRIDGLVFAAIFLVLFQCAFGAGTQWW